jgi:aminopeptidase N
MAAASGRPVDRILSTFVNQAGCPVVEVSRSCSADHPELSLTQRRFFLDPRLSTDAASGVLWQVPICRRSDRGADTCVLMDRPTLSVPTSLDDCRQWTFMNTGARGYYRTAYSTEMLRALAPVAESRLSAAERLSLVGDEWALVQAGTHTAADFLTLASGFGGEQTSGVLSHITTGLRFIDSYLTTSATQGRFRAFVRALLGKQFGQLGIAPASTETDERRELRGVVIDAMGSIGADPEVIRQARAATDQILSGRTTLDPTAADTVVNVAAHHGDVALWEALASAAERAPSPVEQTRYLYALGDFEDPALATRGLEHALTPAVRAQNAGRYLARFLSNPAINARAWTFVKDHWTELQPKISVAFADVRIVQALGSFCDAGTRDDVRAFFATHRLGNAARTIDQTIERIDNCVQLRQEQTIPVTAWLAAQ